MNHVTAGVNTYLFLVEGNKITDAWLNRLTKKTKKRSNIYCEMHSRSAVA